MSTDWANTISYNDFVTAVQNAYRGNSSLTWSQVSQSLANAGCTTDNYLNYLESYPNAVDVVKNANGSIRSVRVNPYASIYSESTWGEATSAGSYNSNLMPPSASSTTTTSMSIPGTPVVESTTKKLTFTQGMKQTGNFIMKEVAPAVVAAGVGIKLGKAIDGAIYNIGNALGLDPPDTLNPETWDSITFGDDSFDARLFNMVFGINDNGNTQAYVDENAFAYMALWMNKNNLFEDIIYNVGKVPDAMPEYVRITNPLLSAQKSSSITYNIVYTLTEDGSPSNGTDYIDVYIDVNKPVYYFSNSSNGNNALTMFANDEPFNGTYYWHKKSLRSDGSIMHNYDSSKFNIYTSTFEFNGKKVYWCYFLIGYFGGPVKEQIYNSVPKNFTLDIYLDDDPNAKENAKYYCWQAVYDSTESTGVSGVNNQAGAKLPDTSNWSDTASTLASLKEQYPELFENAISQDVIQSDGSSHTYTYIPTGFPMPDGSSGTQTQENTQVQPDVSPEELVDYLRDILVPTLPPNPPDIGEGNTPPVIIPTGSASSLWSIYNPTQEQLDSFGAWLWSSDLVEQIKKLFNNPMESIIGVHKVFVEPNVAGTATIKCGYIDSGVSSNYIKEQYVSVDCGSILLTEYFGNVFDYDPYTKINLFLPFIGIVPLNVSDVMRSRISIKYNVDVITGACLAEVHVNRDGAGGIIYTFSGSCIVSYPLSSGSYLGVIGGILGIAGGIMGSFATGGSLAPLLLGSVPSISHLHTNVQKSGSFSGAPGAMGGKIPYLIITRPQTCLADNYEIYDGIGANHTTQLSQCSGYTKVKEVHLKVPNAYESELKEIETMLLSGILI